MGWQEEKSSGRELQICKKPRAKAGSNDGCSQGGGGQYDSAVAWLLDPCSMRMAAMAIPLCLFPWALQQVSTIRKPKNLSQFYTLSLI